MSLQSAKDFIAKASSDESVRKVARERFQDIENVGREHGHDFTKDEFAQAMRERRPASSDADTGPFCQCGSPDDAELCVCSHDFCQCGTPPPNGK